MTYIYIHGNASTSTSFNYIRTCVGGEAFCIDYDSQNGFYENLAHMAQVLGSIEGKMVLIAHSLGGIYAIHLASMFVDRIKNGITISTPYGGCETASFLKWVMPFKQVMRDISPDSKPIIDSHKIGLNIPWMNIVSTGGSSAMMYGSNDGVVTVSSQKYRPDMKLIEVDRNHFEVLLSDTTVSIIKNELDIK
jgi:pimeloyl-ACP methyl ester carboxylesterase